MVVVERREVQFQKEAGVFKASVKCETQEGLM
jgi:hypothetical protein